MKNIYEGIIFTDDLQYKILYNGNLYEVTGFDSLGDFTGLLSTTDYKDFNAKTIYFTSIKKSLIDIYNHIDFTRYKIKHVKFDIDFDIFCELPTDTYMGAILIPLQQNTKTNENNWWF